MPSLYLISLTRVMLKEIVSIYIRDVGIYHTNISFYFILFYFIIKKWESMHLRRHKNSYHFSLLNIFWRNKNRKPSTDNLELERFKSMMISTYGRLTANVEQLRYRENKSILFCFPRKRERESILFSMSIIRAPNGRPSQDGDILFQCPRLI